MFNKAITELYLLRDRYDDDIEIKASIDYIMFELSTGISAVLDILTDEDRKIYKFKN